jgi:hypothetical protein
MVGERSVVKSPYQLLLICRQDYIGSREFAKLINLIKKMSIGYSYVTYTLKNIGNKESHAKARRRKGEKS